MSPSNTRAEDGLELNPPQPRESPRQQVVPVWSKCKKSLADRQVEVAAIRTKFPTKIPIIVDRYNKEKSLNPLDKRKFLVPQEITMSQFVTIIRNRMQLSPQQALYLLVNNHSMSSLSRTLAEVYLEHKDEDGFLYITYASQETFG